MISACMNQETGNQRNSCARRVILFVGFSVLPVLKMTAKAFESWPPAPGKNGELKNFFSILGFVFFITKFLCLLVILNFRVVKHLLFFGEINVCDELFTHN